MARKILLADDSVTAQNMGRKILADAGYEVITVNNGSAALKKIAEQKPDLIVLDVYMPGYSGLEVCQRLKEAQETARVPVLLTVGKLEPFKPEEAKRVRADGFIVKPFEASELLSALSKLEDKIVPRAEASKPGRFARVTASIEEGRYDKTVAIEEDLRELERPVEEALLLGDPLSLAHISLGLERVHLGDPAARAGDAEALGRPAVVDATELEGRRDSLQLGLASRLDVLNAQLDHERAHLGVGQGGMMFDTLDPAHLRQQVFQMTTPTRRIFARPILTRSRPIEDGFNPATHPACGFRLCAPERLDHF